MLDHSYTFHLYNSKFTGILKGISADKSELFFLVNVDGEWTTVTVTAEDFYKTKVICRHK